VLLTIHVKPNSSKEGIEKLPDGSLRISIKVPPVEGKANEAVVALLAKHFSVPKSEVRIVRGMKGRYKVVEIG
jgi:uncharacterized protein